MRGQIVKRGERLYAVVSYKDALTGKWKKKWKAAGTSSRKADSTRTDLVNEAKGGVITKPGRITLGEHLNNWLKDVSVQTLAPRTVEGYQFNIEKYILPKLSYLPLAALTPTHLSKFYSSIIGPDGKNTRTIQIMHNILHEALDYAVEQGLIIRNAADQVKPPKSKRREMNTLTEKEILLALEMAKGSVFYPMFHVDIFTGLRRGELIGLKWGDIDLILSRISVQRGISKIAYGTNKGKIIEKSPKTAKGKRLIKISASTCEVLRQHYEKQKRFKISMDLLLVPEGKQEKDVEIPDDDYVFCNHIGQPYAPHTISTAWRRVAHKVGIKNVRLHDLRHTFATMLLKKGVHAKVVSDMLGHATSAITMDLYSHVSPAMQQDAVDKLDELVFGSVDNPVDNSKSNSVDIR
jgi:integrase